MTKPPPRPPGALWSVDDLAAFIGCTPRSIWRWVRDGRLPKPIAVGGSRRVKRWDPAALAKLLPGVDLSAVPTIPTRR